MVSNTGTSIGGIDKNKQPMTKGKRALVRYTWDAEQEVWLLQSIYYPVWNPFATDGCYRPILDWQKKEHDRVCYQKQ